MNNFPELSSYIKISSSQGDSREQIEASLKGKGWSSEEINQAFEQVSAGAVMRLTVPVPAKPRDRKGQLVTTVAVLGSLLLGLGIILMIASNWQDIGRWTKVVLIFSILMSVYGAGYFMEYKRGYPRIGRALIFLGTLMLGAAIVLIQQIFNIMTESGSTLLWWAFLILPIVYGLELKSSLALATVLVFIWQFLRTNTGMDLFDVLDFNFRMQSVNYWYLLIVGAILVPLTYRIKATRVQPLNLVGLGIWLLIACSLWAGGRGRVNLLGYDYERAIPSLLAAVALLYGVALFSLGRMHQLWDRWKSMESGYTVLGFFSVFFTSFLLSFQEIGDEFFTGKYSAFEAVTWQSGIALVLLVSISLVSMWRYRETETTREQYLGGNVAVLSLMALASAIIFFPSDIYVIFFNVLVFVESLGMIWLGHEAKRGEYINLGLSLFLLMILVKYFQWGYELFDRSLFFIGGGLVLMAVSYFGERQRRRLIGQIK
ncbi:DUF2157 domain-containing protein [Candidatus Falkowbacteria bacterium]|nr:DUF2157 domain-containing protein [Candidatus Falkowbacteria bacterium]